LFVSISVFRVQTNLVFGKNGYLGFKHALTVLLRREVSRLSLNCSLPARYALKRVQQVHYNRRKKKNILPASDVSTINIQTVSDPQFGGRACFLAIDAETMEWKAFSYSGINTFAEAGIQSAQSIVRQIDFQYNHFNSKDNCHEYGN
jgi:hypothetical protein